MNCLTHPDRRAVAHNRCMTCYQRARRAGEIQARQAAPAHGRPYTEAERIVIRSEVGVTPLREIARKLGRTTRAVRSVAERDGLSAELIGKRLAGLSFSDVCLCLGVDRKTVFRWLRAGLVRASKRDTTVRDGCKREVWTFSHDEVERFIREGGALYVMRPVAGWREIYEEARAALLGRLVSRPAVKRLCYISDGSMQRWAEKGFPPPALRGVRGEVYYERTAVRAWLDAHPHYWTRAAREALA